MLKHEVAGLSIWSRIAALRINKLDGLAPLFRTAILAGVHSCEGKTVSVPTGASGIRNLSLDVVVFETLRTDELQGIYFAQGTSKVRSAQGSWHFFGLAVDVISRGYEWFTGAAALSEWPDRTTRNEVARLWFTAVANQFKPHGLKWGGDWDEPDMPHIYYGTLRKSPSDLSRQLYRQGGFKAVWREVGALAA